MDFDKCSYKFYLDEDGKPVIEASDADCQLHAIKSLQGNEVTVTIAGVKAGPEPVPVTES
ncbi:hypothetical protein ES708_30471 [subsurface metagenome]